MDYYVRLIDLPCSVNAVTIMDHGGFYNIYVNAKLDYESQQNAIEHELTHINRDDFYNPDIPLETIETM